jgi:tetratricopeptide (TPR) repeat protein
MRTPSVFADVLGRYVQRSGYSPGQLSRLSGIPKPTIVNWLVGRVAKPRQRDDLLRLAASLHLDADETSAVLSAAGYPALAQLLAGAHDDGDRQLLAPWLAVAQQRHAPPFQSIADLPSFVGRAAEIDAICQALLHERRAHIFSLCGMGGVGKTTLAAHLAYRLRDQFPDGVLWARVDTADPMAVLYSFASTYDCDISHYTDLDSRSRVVRDLLSRKRTLIILDNVGSAAELEPLLPPSGDCVVIVTTRRHDLAVAFGAQQFTIGPFDPRTSAALELFECMLGKAYLEQYQTQLQALAEALGHLPLALAIVACRLAYDPDCQPDELLSRLRDEHAQLTELMYGEQNVRASLNVSFNALPPHLRASFVALGAFGGDSFDVPAAAAVAGCSFDAAQQHIREIHRRSLVQYRGQGRYQLHPLVRAYAREQAGGAAAQAALVAYYIGLLEQRHEDYNLLDREQSNLLAAFQIAAEQGMLTALMRGAALFVFYLDARGLYDRAMQLLAEAFRQASTVGDSHVQARLLLYQGLLAHNRRRHRTAEAALRQGLALAQANEDEEGIAWMLMGLGMILLSRGDPDAAEAHLRSGLELSDPAGDLHLRSMLIQGLGEVALHCGDQAEAARCFEQSLELMRRDGRRRRQIPLLQNLGVAALNREALEQAETYFTEGLALAREFGHGGFMGALLGGLGEVATLRGEWVRAEALMAEALQVAQQAGYRWLAVAIENSWGELELARGHVAKAAAVFERALRLARELELQQLVGDALYGLARVAHRQGADADARRLAQEALACFTASHNYRAAEVAGWLAALPG